MSASSREFDLAVVGAGIIGLSCALAAARRKLRVVVIERDVRACGASVRNFGLITVTGQDRDADVASGTPLARDMARGRGPGRSPGGTARPVARRAAPRIRGRARCFLRTDMAEGCRLLTPMAARERCPQLQTSALEAVLWSPHELRVESREAMPRLAAWLASEYGVAFRWATAVHAVDPPRIETSRGPLVALAAAVCPGDDFVTLYPERLAAAGIDGCTLQMLRLESPGYALPGTVMSDLSLLRYGGFANLPQAGALRRRLQSEQPEHLRHGVRLIIAQASDGSLVVGDSHRYDAPMPFAARGRVRTDPG